MRWISHLLVLILFAQGTYAVKQRQTVGLVLSECEKLAGVELGGEHEDESRQNLVETDYVFNFGGRAFHIFSMPEIEARLAFLGNKKTNSALASDLLSRFYPGMIDSVLGKTLGRAVMWHKRWDGSV